MKKRALLLLKNEFKQSLRNKVQLVGLIFLILLVSTIFSVMRSTTVRVVDQYEILNRDSNLHDFIIDLYNSEINGKNENDDSYDFLKQDAVENAAHNPENLFHWARIETRTFSLANNGEQKLLKAIAYDKDILIDKLIVTEGENIGEDKTIAKEKQVVLNKEFAENNGIELNSIIRLQADDKGERLLVSHDSKIINDPINSNFNWFKVVGFGVSADFTMTKIDQTTIIPNKTREGLVYVDPLQFGLVKRANYLYKESKNSFWDYDKNQELLTISSSKDREVYFTGKFYVQENLKYDFPKNQIPEKVAKLSDQLKGESDKWWIKTNPFEKWNEYNVYDLLQNIIIPPIDTIRQKELQNQKIIEEQLVKLIKEKFKKQQNDRLKWDDSWTIKFFYKDSSGKETPFDFTAIKINDITNPIKIGFQVLANNNSIKYEQGNLFTSDKMELEVTYNPGEVVKHNPDKPIEEDVYELVKNYGVDEDSFDIPKISSSYLRQGLNQNINNIKIEVVKDLITSLKQKAVYSFNDIKKMQDYLEKDLNITVSENDGSAFNEQINTDTDLKRNLKITLSIYDLVTNTIDIEVSFKKNITKSFYSTIDRSEKLVYSLFDPSYQYNSRVSSLDSTIKGYRRLMELLLVLTMIIASITLALVIRKAIDNSKVQIGILKSLGYSNGKILITSLTYPMIGSFCSALLTYFTSLPLQKLVINIFSKYYNLDFGVFYFSWLSFLYTIILTFGFLSLVALVVTLIAIWKKPIDLIKYDAHSTTSWMARKIKFVVRKRKFNTRFKVAMFSSSIGKISAVSVTMLLGTVLMTGAITGPKIMKDNLESTYDGLEYNSIVEYESPIFNSPLSFYKTYNPNAPAWGDEINRGSIDAVDMKNADNKIIKEILDNNINSEYYSPYYDASSSDSSMALGMNITHFPWKGFTSAFLEKLSNYSDKDSDFVSMVCKMAWPDYRNIETAFSKVLDLSNSKTNALTYDQFRNFYRIYHSTIDLHIQKHLRMNNLGSGEKESINNLFNKTELKKFINEIKNYDDTISLPLNDTDPIIEIFSFEKDGFRIKDDTELIIRPSSYFKDQEIIKNWIKRFTIWYLLLFYNNAGQSITQGVYTRAPYFVRQQMAKSFKDKGSFNVFFNVIPFNKKIDELGTYFEANKFDNKDLTFKVYGIQDDSNYIKLTNEAEEKLNQKIASHTFKDDEPVNIVINETIAQKLSLKPDDIVGLDINSNQMIKTPSTLNPNPVTSGEILNGFNIPKYTPMDGVSKNSNMLWSFTTMKNEHLVPSEALYNPGMAGNESTNVNKEVSQGNVAIDKFKIKKQKFKIVGIHKGYGEPKAYIAKNAADKLLKYNLSKEKLFEIFANQWAGHAVDLPNKKNYEFHDYTNDAIDSEKIDKGYWNLSDFQERALKDPNSVEADILKIFNNEYPVFNFKVSSIKEIDKIAEVTSGFTTYQAYGDFTELGLNGGIDFNTKTTYSGYGKGAAKFILPLSVHKEILDQITSLSNLILIMFAILALMVSFIIILLTSNLIIYENRKTIATMKVLGYVDRKITNILIGMYLPILAITFIGGFVSGWYIIKAILSHLALTTSWVLPLAFAWWLPVIVGAIVLGMYVLTFVAGWFSTKRINPLYALKVND